MERVARGGLLAAVLAALLALLIGVNALPGAFLADDVPVVVRDPRVARLDVIGIFTTDYWGGGLDSGLYRPLTTLSFAVNRALFGPGPLSFHLVNATLHAGVTFFLALTLHALGFGPPLALTAAALFALHPIHADVVNIVVGRAELLVALLLFAGLWLALRPGGRALPAVAACYCAALLCKEHAVVFVPLLVVCDAFVAVDAATLARRRRSLYTLLLVITAGWLLLRWWLRHAAGAPPLMIYAADNPLVDAGLAVRLLTVAKVNLLYLANLLLPLRLQSVYSGPGLQTVTSVGSWWGLAALGYGALLGATLARGWRRRSPVAFGAALFLIGSAVTANLFFLTTVLMADRFAYLPAAGFCVAAAGVLLLPAQQTAHPRFARLLLLAPVGYALLLAFLTLGRNADFRDPEAFWKSAIRIDPGNVRAWFFLAQAADEKGRVEETEQALREAVRADPSFPDAWIAYSLFLLERGRPTEAAAAARTAMGAAPGGVGLAQFALARASLQLGRPAEALSLLDEVAPIFDDSVLFWRSRGEALTAVGRAAEAAAAYRRALSADDGADGR